MKKYFYLLFSLFMLTASMSIVSCSSSSDDNDGGNYDPSNKLCGVWKADNYVLNLYDNGTFDAVDNSTSKQYVGDYIYANDILELYGVATRAFSLEPGKTYKFKVELSDGKMTLTNTETNESYVMEYSGPTEHKEISYDAAGEKKYIEQTMRQLESYFDAKEWEEFTVLNDEFKYVKNCNELDDMVESLVNKKTISTGQYEDVIEKVILLSNLKGQYVGSYRGRWAATGKEGACKFTYTAKDQRVWVLEVNCTGNLGELYWDYEREYYYNYVSGSSHVTRYNEYIQIPQKVTAKLTCNGTERATVDVNISQFSNAEDREISVLGHTAGNFNVKVVPNGEVLTAEGNFNYADNQSSTVNVTVKKGNVTLVNVQSTAKLEADKADEINEATANVTATILNKLTIKASTNSLLSIVEAMDEADDRKLSESKVKEQADKVNKYMSVTVSNGPSADKVADIAFTTKKDREGVYTNLPNPPYYSYQEREIYVLTPVLKFNDGSTYAFEDYFTEAYFGGVLDKAEDIIKGFENLVDKDDEIYSNPSIR